jgi:uncharacterized RDD family membrane protein YckC
VEGALAAKPEPLRELPGVRKKEKTWRDEVNDRVRSRRKKRDDQTGLPLFDGVSSDSNASSPEPSSAPDASPGAAAPRIESTVLAGAVEEPIADLPLHRIELEPPFEEDDALRREAAIAEAAQEPVRRAEAPAFSSERSEPTHSVAHSAEPVAAGHDEEEWPLTLSPPASESRPVERPAQIAERLQAGAVDFLLLSGVSSVVLYFTSRAARVTMAGLLPAWPWLAAYLALLGLTYAAYFTGTTGQTLGKMLVGLRVVDTAGQPPGYLRAFLRAALGALSLAAAGLGLVPMAFDPARRGLHDRVFRTRVVRG